MATDAQRKALKAYRQRQQSAGLTRFEVSAPANDKDLIRRVAKRLAEAGPQAEAVREALGKIVAGTGSTTGGIWRALRASPLVGAEVEFRRDVEGGRKVEL